MCVAGAVNAQCDAKLDTITHIYDDFQNYRAFQSTDAKKELKINVIDGENCQLYMTITSENLGRLTGAFQHIEYQIKNNDNALINSSISRSNFIDSSTNITLIIPAGTQAKSGSYSDRLEMELYDSNNILLDERQFDVGINIAASTSISVLGYNAFANTVNLGELVSGQVYQMLPSLQVVTNSDIQLQVSSENKGTLQHSFYKEKYAINYNMSLSGQWIELKQVTHHKFSYTGETFFLLPLKVQLDNFERLAAGEYTDTIRFQISPLNY